MNFQELGESEEEKLDEKRVNLMSDGRRERERCGGSLTALQYVCMAGKHPNYFVLLNFFACTVHKTKQQNR